MYVDAPSSATRCGGLCCGAAAAGRATSGERLCVLLLLVAQGHFTLIQLLSVGILP